MMSSPNLRMCYTRRDKSTMWVGDKGCANSDDQPRRSGPFLECFQDNLHRLRVQPFGCKPLWSLTLDLFGDVGLRIRRVSYLYTANALKLHMWLVKAPAMFTIRHNHHPSGLPYDFDKYGTYCQCRRVLAYRPCTCLLLKPKYQALVQCCSVYWECTTSSLPPAV